VLAADARLRNRDEFTATVRRGRRVARGALVVHVAAPTSADPTAPIEPATWSDPAHVDGSPPARAGFVVSKEVGGAVVRNRVKRRLRHLIRPHLGRIPAGTDVVVRALPAAATKRYADLQADLDAALTAALRSDRTHTKERAGR